MAQERRLFKMKTNKDVSSADIAESLFMDYKSDPVILKKRSQGISSMTADEYNKIVVSYNDMIKD